MRGHTRNTRRRQRTRAAPTAVMTSNIEDPIIVDSSHTFSGEGKQMSSSSDKCTKIINKRICEKRDCYWKGGPNTGICLDGQAKMHDEVLNIAKTRPIKKIVLKVSTQIKQGVTFNNTLDSFDEQRKIADRCLEEFEYKDPSNVNEIAKIAKTLGIPMYENMWVVCWKIKKKLDQIENEEHNLDEEHEEHEEYEEHKKHEEYKIDSIHKSVKDAVPSKTLELLDEAFDLEEAVIETNGQINELNAKYISALTNVVIQPGIVSQVFGYIQQVLSEIPGATITIISALGELVKVAYDNGGELVNNMYEFAGFVNELISSIIQGTQNIGNILVEFFDKVVYWLEKTAPLLRGASNVMFALMKFMIVLLRALYMIISFLTPKLFAVLGFAVPVVLQTLTKLVKALISKTMSIKFPDSSKSSVLPKKIYRRKRNNLLIELREEAERWGVSDADLGEMPVGLRKGEKFKLGYMGGGSSSLRSRKY